MDNVKKKDADLKIYIYDKFEEWRKQRQQGDIRSESIDKHTKIIESKMDLIKKEFVMMLIKSIEELKMDWINE